MPLRDYRMTNSRRTSCPQLASISRSALSMLTRRSASYRFGILLVKSVSRRLLRATTRAPTASSSFSTLAAPMVRINSSSSSALSNRPLGFQPNNSSSTSTIINREVSPCKLACQDHSSQLTSRLAVQTTAPSFSEDLRGSTPDASVK